MRNIKREKSETSLPATLVYATALTCGVLAAIAVQIQLNRAGFDLVGLWRSLTSTGSARAMELRTTVPWWAIAVAAFIVSGITAAALSRLALPWRRFRLLRWAAGAAIVYVLADIGHHSAAGLAREAASVNTIISLAVLAIAALMALCGAYLTVRR
jgi:hypothetical protein